jgi:putative lipoprotein (rSAM/lipoprotein system)
MNLYSEIGQIECNEIFSLRPLLARFAKNLGVLLCVKTFGHLTSYRVVFSQIPPTTQIFENLFLYIAPTKEKSHATLYSPSYSINKLSVMSSRYLHFVNVLISGCLTLLGFSCNLVNPPVEYGTPNAEFIVNGTVTSSETEEAIKNIRVIMKNDTVYTDNDGNYEVTDKGAFPTDQTYTIQFQDIDNELNASFDDKDTIVEFKNPEFSHGDGHWFEGEATKEFDIKLTPKK